MSDCVLMPVYNEAKTIGAVLDAVRRHFSDEIVVIDDGSHDGTQRVLAEREDIAVVRLDRNYGYGCALRIGFDVAHELCFDKIVTMDCDGQHEPGHIPEFLGALDGGPDIVSGSRYLPDSGDFGLPPADRREINERISAEVNKVTAYGITDAFCGFKAYRATALAKLNLTESGYAMPLELWAKAWRAGLTVSELAVERIYCDHDRSFGVALDDPVARFDYYMEVWSKALKETM